jgi:hypothetical protein
MGELADRIAVSEGWPVVNPDTIGTEAALGAPLAIFFAGAKANRRESDDVAVVLRELTRAGRVRACLPGAAEGALKRRFGVVAAPSLVIAGRGGHATVPLIADWGGYLAAIATVSEPQLEGAGA